MKVTHKLDEFLFNILKDKELTAGDHDSIVRKVKDQFSHGPFKPVVTIADNSITIEMDVDQAESQTLLYDKVTNLCDRGMISEAKPLLDQLINVNPTVSDYWRVKGQIAEVEKRYEDAINDLINALKWDPENHFALLMMGNVYARHKNDVDTALIFLNKAIEINPKDHLAINNVGGLLLQAHKLELAKEYFNKALAIKPSFTKSIHGLGIVYEQLSDFSTSFEYYLTSFNSTHSDTIIKDNSLNAINRIAKKFGSTDILDIEIAKYITHLEKLGQKPVRKESAPDIPVLAKIEIAENYNRAYHLLKVKADDAALPHLVMHELVHLDYILQARLSNENQLFMATDKEYNSFISDIQKLGVKSQDYSDKLKRLLFDGLNSQAYNTPIDLFIEEYLFHQWPKFRPVQFSSIYIILSNGIKATTDPQIISHFPAKLVSISKVYNLVLAIQFKALYKTDLIPEFKPDKKELTLAQKLYDEYLEYRNNKEPGEEYELIQHWGADLGIDKYFLISPDPNNKDTSAAAVDPLEDIISKIEMDPLNMDEDYSAEESETQKFSESHSGAGINMAIVAYMNEAIKYFDKLPADKIREIAMDIAMHGRHGFNTNKTDYRITSIPGLKFTGYQILAWCYVSFALSQPELLKELGLPFEREYALAKGQSLL